MNGGSRLWMGFDEPMSDSSWDGDVLFENNVFAYYNAPAANCPSGAQFAVHSNEYAPDMPKPQVFRNNRFKHVGS